MNSEIVTDPSKKSGQRLVGDVAYEEASKVASYITPVPGGVGPMTVAMLMRNTVLSAQKAVKHILDNKWNLRCLPLRPQTPVPRSTNNFVKQSLTCMKIELDNEHVTEDFATLATLTGEFVNTST